MRTLRHILFFSLGLGLAAGTFADRLWAQTQPTASESPQAPERPTITLRFMSWERASTGVYLKISEYRYVEINAPAYGWGTTLSIPKTRNIVLYNKVEREGRKVFEELARTSLPEHGIDFQIALVRQSGEKPYRLIVLPSDSREFRAGDVRVFNFTPWPARVKLGTETLSLSPLEWRKVTIIPDQKYRVALLSALQISGNWILSSQDVLILRPDYRGDVMLIQSRSAAGAYSGGSNGPAAPLTIAQTEYLLDARHREKL